MKEDIIYLDMLNDKPLMVLKEEVEVDKLNIVAEFSKRYSIAEIEEQQNRINIRLNEHIELIKRILVLLMNNDERLIPSLDAGLFLDNLNRLIEEDDFNIDEFFMNIGISLSSKYNKNNASLSTEEELVLFNYLKEMNLTEFQKEKIELRLVDIEEAFNHFECILKILIEIKKKLDSFFQMNEANIDFTDLFLQFEFIVILDNYYHMTSKIISNYLDTRKYPDLRQDYPEICTDFTLTSFKYMFTNSKGILDTFKIVKYSLVRSLEEELRSCLKDEVRVYNFSDKMLSKYSDKKIVYYDVVNNKYIYYFNNEIITFDYIYDIVDGLKYAYHMKPLFLIYFLFHKNV